MDQRAADLEADSGPVTDGGGGQGGPDLDASEEALLEALLEGDGEDIEALEAAVSGEPEPDPQAGGADEALELSEEPGHGPDSASEQDETGEAGAESESAEAEAGSDADAEAEPSEPSEAEAESADEVEGGEGPEDAAAEASSEAEPELDRGSPPTAEAGPPPGMPEETFDAYVDAAAALLFASPEPLGTARLLELLTAAEKAAAAEEAARARAAAAEAAASAEGTELEEADVQAAEAEAEDADAEAVEEGDAAEDDGADDESDSDVPELSGSEDSAEEAAEAEAEPAAAKRVKLGKAGVGRVLAELSRRFEAARVPIVVREIAGGWRLFTDERLGEVVARLDRSRRVERISQAALETLSIIAYRQPVTKAEIEAIRGVQAGPVLRQLVDRRLAKVAGRADQPGSPLLYGTTDEFLDRFGLAGIEELPRDGELTRD